MTKHLSKEFKSLSEAEEALKIDYVMDLSQPKTSDPSTFTSPERNPRCSSIPLSPIEPTGNGHQQRLDKVTLSRRGDPGVFVANRASIPQKGQLTARAKFHREPISLPVRVPTQDGH